MMSVDDAYRLDAVREALRGGNGAKMESMITGAPLRREDILSALRDSGVLLQSFGVSKVALFGSFARDEGRNDSDVDLLVEFNRPIGLFEFARLQRVLAERLGHPIDLVTPAALKPQFRERILHEAIVAA